ncbi:MAG: VWA-like domain-containing protein [Blautia sp.]|nr:VWA-like domain-containing protein [Blautia sp.]
MINAVHDQQARALETEDICNDILKNSRNELYINMRFLDNALSSLVYEGDGEIKLLGTDGRLLFYQPRELMELFCKGHELVNRAYLHSLFHCVFLHVFPREEKGLKPDREYWDLACDVAVEEILDGLYLKCIHIPQSAARRQAKALLLKEGRVVTAQRVYRRLQKLHLPQNRMDELKREFTVDDHRKWYETLPGHPKTQMLRNNWEDIRNKMQTEMETFSKEAAKDGKSLMDQLSAENRQRYDYKEFLRKFSVLKEEMKVDMDAFDYIYYQYGMELYGNMPLIEPLETKEERRVEDFVIVLDTSMSCKGELIQKFLEETYSVLSETESFFRRIHVHIIQCDDKIQSDTLIENAKQLEQYMKNVTIKGQGGTDFRPPFAYVQELLRQKKFTKLRGLIYFTDGYGTFPAKKPDYETAFVFLKEDYRDIDVPPWAIKLILGEEDFS